MAYLTPLRIILTLICVTGTMSTNQNVDYKTAYIQDEDRSLLCVQKNVSDVAGRVASHKEVERAPYADGMDCTFTMNAQRGQHINIRFEYFDVAPSYDNREKRCRPGGDLLSIYESGNIFLIKTSILEPELKLCGGTGDFPSDYLSSGNVLTVRFNTNEYPTNDKGVRFTYTVYTDPRESTSKCFMCKDNTMCISKDLTCNGMPNCNDDSDEQESLCAPSNIFEKGVEELGVGVMAAIGAAVGLLLLCLIILCVVCCCCCSKRKKSSDQKGQYRAPPTPRPGSYPSHNSNYSSYSSSASNTAGRPYPNFPPGYPPFHNGGYSVAYNYENGRMEFPHKV